MGRRYSMGKRRKPNSAMPTEQRLAKAGGYFQLIPTETAGVQCVLAHDASLLDRLHFDGFLGEGQEAQWRVSAGNQLRALHEAAGLAVPGAADLSRGQDGTANPRDLAHIEDRAFWRYSRIINRLGPIHGQRCRDVACFDLWTPGMLPSGLLIAFDALVDVVD